MSKIHPSASIDSTVEIAGDVEIGPGCIFEGDIRIGKGCTFKANVYMKGPLVIGEGNVFYPNCYIGYEPQDKKFDPETKGAGTLIGKNNIFREGVSIHRATGEAPTTIGEENYLMVNSHVGHDSVMGNENVLVNGSLVAGHVEIANKVIMGGNSAVHQGVRVGDMAMISGGVAIAQDLTPFSVSHYLKTVGSLNVIGLRRGGYREHIKPLQKSFDILYKQNLPNKKAAAMILDEFGDDEMCVKFAEFVLGTKRGILKYDVLERT
ncbi:acyl-ACP--UDP-N-acetylglucosamine O-acyltransferase [Planctomycetota bacterium]|nr:acyl-ACP--UDP-N-acetylglucosamine O-acyltransferase [Planctomycetota bacterium]